MQTPPKILAFDLDGTLTPSKSNLEYKMAEILVKLLSHVPIVVVSGASERQFEEQFLNYLSLHISNFSSSEKDKVEKLFKNLYIFPENGAEMMEYKDGKWVIDYEKKLYKKQEEEIISVLELAIEKFNLKEKEEYGKIIEDRGEQITMSALGQKAPLEIKEKWDADQKKRQEIRAFIEPLLYGYEIGIGGATSIDITKKGINKAYAMEYILKMLNLNKENMLYFGDALFEGGNDEIVKKDGIPCFSVNNSEETLIALHDIIKEYEKDTHK